MPLNRPVLFEKWWMDPKECGSRSGLFTCTKEGSVWGMWAEDCSGGKPDPIGKMVAGEFPLGHFILVEKTEWEMEVLEKGGDILPSILMLPSSSVNRSRRPWVSCFLLVSASESLWWRALLAVLHEMLGFKEKHSFNALMKAGDFV